MENNIETIIREMLDKMGVSYEDVFFEESAVLDSPRYVIKSEDAPILIGPRGEHFHSFRYLLKKIIENNKEVETKNFIIDIGDYQEKKIQDIKNRAIILGERARFFKTKVEVEPMTAYERMIIHSSLQGQKNLKTESAGFGKGRHVVIMYVEEEGQEDPSF